MRKTSRVVFYAPTEMVESMRAVLAEVGMPISSLFLPVVKDVAKNGLRINAKPPTTATPSTTTPAPVTRVVTDPTDEELELMDFPDEE
jgi:hypothetical protein